VQISEATQKHVIGGGVSPTSFVLEHLGVKEIKGKGSMSTYRAKLPTADASDVGGRGSVTEALSPGPQVVIVDHDGDDDDDDWFANARRGSATGMAIASMMSPSSSLHRGQISGGFAMRNSGIVACLEENILRDMRMDAGGAAGNGNSNGEPTSSAQLLFQMPEEDINEQLSLLVDNDELRLHSVWLRWVQGGAEEIYREHCRLEYIHGVGPVDH
jgi:hypothetical protein